MVNNFNSGFKEGLPSFCTNRMTNRMTSYMQVVYRDVDPSIPNKDGNRKEDLGQNCKTYF